MKHNSTEERKIKFDIGDKFYIFEEHSYGGKGFEIRTYRVTDILISGNNVSKFKSNDTRWFDGKECLTKEEVIKILNFQIEKLKEEN